MDRLYEILEKSGASDFLIRETTTCSREAFFIGQKLDMGRAKEVRHTFVTVYVAPPRRSIPPVVQRRWKKKFSPLFLQQNL